MAFGVLVVGMIMGLLAAVAIMPSDAGLLLAATSYVAVGTLTFMSVIFFAMLTDAAPDNGEIE